MNIYHVDLIELSDYVSAYNLLPKIKSKKESMIESLYEDCISASVYVNTALGEIRPVSINVEEMAIFIIERKEAFDRQIQRIERKAQTFEQALATLSDQERAAIQAHYLQRCNDVPPKYFHQTLKGAEKKLCMAISKKQIQNTREDRAATLQQAILRVEKWKQATSIM